MTRDLAARTQGRRDRLQGYRWEEEEEEEEEEKEEEEELFPSTSYIITLIHAVTHTRCVGSCDGDRSLA